MTPTEQTTRDILRGDVLENKNQMDITQESRELLSALLRDDMRLAVAEGISAAMTDANARLFVRATFSEAQKMAAEKSVEVAGGIFKALLLRAVTFTVLGWVVYSLGGWTTLAAFVKFASAAKG